jgi:hypothetical protein
MKRKRLITRRLWRPSLLSLLALLIIGALLSYRLGTLVPGLSRGEIAARIDSNSLHHILRNPFNAPYKLLVYTLIRLDHHGALALRSVAALYGVASLWLFYYILRRWQSGRIAVLGTLLFATSSWFLFTARMGTPQVLLFGLLFMVAAGLWLRRTHHRALALYICVAAIAVSLYVPGFVWFALAGIAWRRQVIRDELRHITWWRLTLGALLLLAWLAPLGYGILRQPNLLLTVAGLPSHVPSLRSLGHNALNIPLLLFFRAPPLDATTWVGRLPILDVFDSAMFALGVYAYARHWRLDRAGLLFGILLLGILLVTAGGPVSISILIPFVYLVVAGGITYMVYEWFSIFPLNPFARSVGVGLMFLAIVASSSFQLSRYFIAWPHSSATKAAFTRQT